MENDNKKFKYLSIPLEYNENSNDDTYCASDNNDYNSNDELVADTVSKDSLLNSSNNTQSRSDLPIAGDNKQSKNYLYKGGDNSHTNNLKNNEGNDKSKNTSYVVSGTKTRNCGGDTRSATRLGWTLLALTTLNMHPPACVDIHTLSTTPCQLIYPLRNINSYEGG